MVHELATKRLELLKEGSLRSKTLAPDTPCQTIESPISGLAIAASRYPANAIAFLFCSLSDSEPEKPCMMFCVGLQPGGATTNRWCKMNRTELIIQLLKVAIGLAFGAYFVWWSLEVLDRLTPESDVPTAVVGRAS
jgi:hypothetical protein